MIVFMAINEKMDLAAFALMVGPLPLMGINQLMTRRHMSSECVMFHNGLTRHLMATTPKEQLSYLFFFRRNCLVFYIWRGILQEKSEVMRSHDKCDALADLIHDTDWKASLLF